MGGRLDGKAAVITGGGSGIGRATVLRFLDEGARVVVADLNDKRGQETVELAAAAGHEGRAVFARADVSVEDDVKSMIGRCRETFGKVDVVYNNAGIPGAVGGIADLSVEAWDFTFSVLVRGVFLGIKHGAIAMREQGSGGCILATASVAGLSGGCAPHGYSAAKAAVLNLVRSAAVELAADEIRVNALLPGGILTPLVHREQPREAFEEPLRISQPWPGVGEPEDIAGGAVYLASDDARFVTGAHLVIDGGMVAAGPHVYRNQWDVAGGFLDKGTIER